MQWQDRGIILKVQKYGEHSAIVTLFTREHGLHKGMAKSAFSKTQRGIYQPGNIIDAVWRARLAEQLGNFTAELISPIAALTMQDPLKLSGVTSLLSLFSVLLPEHARYQTLFEDTESLLSRMAGNEPWLCDYVKLEMRLLEEIGFGLDLTSCVATGVCEELLYVSPKSGRAVSRGAGEPYKDKLLTLPAFLLGEEILEITTESIRAGLALTGFFLKTHGFAPHGMNVPEARERLARQVG
ncbi:MAG: recO [Rickettsiales bacterium]|jgi:DNA repair protein RecO (recombination protein O)|nr:recO [Rickettsiales bacterium]